jgi:hypothetical protein
MMPVTAARNSQLDIVLSQTPREILKLFAPHLHPSFLTKYETAVEFVNALGSLRDQSQYEGMGPIGRLPA